MWGLLACSGGYWLLRLGPSAMPTPAGALSAGDRGVVQADLSRLFGASASEPAETPAQPAAESRFKLLGVVAPKRAGTRNAGEGVALLTVDGGPPRTVRVGAMLDGEYSLLAVEARSVTLGRAGVPAFSLQLAPPTEAAAGTLPVAAPSPVILGGNAGNGPPIGNGGPPPLAVGNMPLPPMQSVPLPNAPEPNSVPLRQPLQQGLETR